MSVKLGALGLGDEVTVEGRDYVVTKVTRAVGLDGDRVTIEAQDSITAMRSQTEVLEQHEMMEQAQRALRRHAKVMERFLRDHGGDPEGA